MLTLLLGSNIGNFDDDDALAFLQRVRAAGRDADWLLLGVDLVKPARDLVLAYDDPLGVTAAFNKNLLVRLNRELDTEFDTTRFRHYAFYNPVAGRIEMHLLSLAEQVVNVAGQRFHFALGETLHTEHSYKFRCDEFSALAQGAGWKLDGEWQLEGFAVQLYSGSR